MTYTLAQLRGFTAAAAQDDRDRVADYAVATRMAMAAPQADWRAYLAALSNPVPAGKQPGTDNHG